MSGLTTVELCAGAGGQALGLHLAGFNHRLAIEIDEMASQTLENNLNRLAAPGTPPLVLRGDVADEELWRPEDYSGTSLLAGGVPCPPFSIAGRQLGANDERDLFAWAVEAAGRMQPDALMLENVRGLSMPRFAGYRQAVLDRLDELGYVASWRLLEARNFGVPQLRPRFVLVALRPDTAPYFHWPEASDSPGTVGELLYDLMAANGWPGAWEWSQSANGVGPTIVGGSKKHGGPDLGPTRAKEAWATLNVDAYGVANVAPGVDVPKDFRPKLTTEMLARLQGWYGEEYKWEFVGRKTHVYRQIGNAFPPPMARSIGASIRDALLKVGKVAEATEADLAFHDEVYRVLREATGYLAVSTIAGRLQGRFTVAEIAVRIENLEKDFIVERKRVRGADAVLLGSWKAFRGQAQHSRHAAFATKRERARIS